MDRTLLSFNIPNFITIAIMAIGAWLIAGLIWQSAKKYVPEMGGEMEAA